MREFHVTNELLLQAFWGGTMCRNNCFTQCTGYFYSDEYSFGRGFIEFCIARIFNIHRVPGFEQHYLKDGSSIKMLHQFRNLKKQDIDAACQELESLYHFVQEELKNSRYCKDGKIRLNRCLRSFEINAVTPQLLAGDNTIIMPANIMTSYAHDGRRYGYMSNISVFREVPIEKIIMFDECLFHPENVCAHDIHGGEYEVWVVEDNIFGEIELDRSCFKYDQLDESISRGHMKLTRREIEASLFADERVTIKPCQWGMITPKLIEHNKKEIKKLYKIPIE